MLRALVTTLALAAATAAAGLSCAGGDGGGEDDRDADSGGDADAQDADGDADSGEDADAQDADGPDADAVAALIESVEAAAGALVDPSGSDPERAVGLVVVLVSGPHDGVVGAGALRAGGSERPSGGTAFQIGSVTKLFTGLILASLVEVAEVAAGDLANDHLGSDVRAPSFGDEGITLLHLVSHYSSLPSMPDNLTGPPTSPAAGYDRARLGEFLGRLELASAPGTSYLYSNLGAGLLGLALADATEEPGYDALLATRITGPLGMIDTGTNEPELVGRLGARVAQGYLERSGSLVPVDLADMGVLAGGGEVISTGDDLALLLRALTGLDPFPAPGAVARALSPVGPGAPGARIGYAVDILEQPDGAIQYEKGGLTAGYTAFVAFRREPAAGVAILSGLGRHEAVPATAREVLSLLVELAEGA